MIVTLDASVEANVPVTSVVVYEDRAEVSRTVAAVLEGAGTHQIVVEGLSRHVLGSSGTFFSRELAPNPRVYRAWRVHG